MAQLSSFDGGVAGLVYLRKFPLLCATVVFGQFLELIHSVIHYRSYVAESRFKQPELLGGAFLIGCVGEWPTSSRSINRLAPFASSAGKRAARFDS